MRLAAGFFGVFVLLVQGLIRVSRAHPRCRIHLLTDERSQGGGAFASEQCSYAEMSFLRDDPLLLPGGTGLGASNFSSSALSAPPTSSSALLYGNHLLAAPYNAGGSRSGGAHSSVMLPSRSATTAMTMTPPAGAAHSINEAGLRRLHQIYQSRLESIYTRFAQTASSIAHDITVQVMGRDQQSADFVADRIAEIVRASIYDEKELTISQLSLQVATSSSQLTVADSERSYLRANMDSQMSSTAAALREGIATSQKQAWTQRQADAQHREALRAEAVAYAERSDTRGRELAEVRA